MASLHQTWGAQQNSKPNRSHSEYFWLKLLSIIAIAGAEKMRGSVRAQPKIKNLLIADKFANINQLEALESLRPGETLAEGHNYYAVRASATNLDKNYKTNNFIQAILGKNLNEVRVIIGGLGLESLNLR